jgi:O-acetyl-ADP-ribose deacetylase (regulator of RNase III)
MFVFETNSFVYPKYIINFPTKRHWRDASKIDDIESGLAGLIRVICEYKISTIALPPLGCGLGGLDWNLVKSKIELAFADMKNVQIAVYEPVGAPEAADMIQDTKVPPITPGRAALVGLITRYLDGLLDPYITLLEIHKLLYFLQEAGEPLRLKYMKALYGPYAENLRHVLNAVEGYLVSGYADGGDDPRKQINVIAGAKETANEFLLNHSDTMLRIERISNLVDGFETPLGLELLSTVHYLVSHGADSVNDVVEQVHAWNERKRQFNRRHIEIALQRLVDQNWIEPIIGME